MESLFNRIRKIFKGKYSFLHSFFQDEKRYTGWFVNGAVLWDKFPAVEKDEAGFIGDVPIYFYAENVKREEIENEEALKKILVNRTRKDLKGYYFKHIFDFISYQSEILQRDLIACGEYASPIPRGVVLLGRKEKVFIEQGANVYPGAVLDSREGNIYISEGTTVMPLSVIQGPCFIGEDVLVDSAKLRPGNSIFNGCKVAGEIEESIFLQYVNKHHEGFIGHSYVGSFVNFGAMTTNSDLKNNYSSVRLFLNNQTVDSGIMKLGAFVGDHTKFGIGSLLNSGSVIGIGCGLYPEKGGLYPKYVPSFAWGSGYPFKKYQWETFVENTNKIMSRRNKTLSKGELGILNYIYDQLKEKSYEKF